MLYKDYTSTDSYIFFIPKIILQFMLQDYWAIFEPSPGVMVATYSL